MAALIVLAILLAFFGLGGFFIKVLWYVLMISILLWLIGFFMHGPETRWYYW